MSKNQTTHIQHRHWGCISLSTNSGSPTAICSVVQRKMCVVVVFGFVIGGARYPLSYVFPLFVVLFAIFQSFFLSVGPGDCNFLVSSESFPTPIRGHFLEFAAAIGKAGAAIGTTILTQALNSFEVPVRGQQVLYLIRSAISVVGVGFVWFLIPEHNETLEKEDFKFREYLEAEAYDVSKMGLPDSL